MNDLDKTSPLSREREKRASLALPILMPAASRRASSESKDRPKGLSILTKIWSLEEPNWPIRLVIVSCKSEIRGVREKTVISIFSPITQSSISDNLLLYN